jgi:hypothetical protein
MSMPLSRPMGTNMKTSCYGHKEGPWRETTHPVLRSKSCKRCGKVMRYKIVEK